MFFFLLLVYELILFSIRDSKEEGEADDEDEKRPETEEGEDKKEVRSDIRKI